MKRKINTSPSPAKLVKRTSTAHPAVTLYEQDKVNRPEPSPSRRSKRLKVEPIEPFAVPDLEDAPFRTPPKVQTDHDVPLTTTDKKPSVRKSKAIKTSLDTPHPAPLNWEEVYGKIREMRSRYVAPVDHMGCSSSQRGEVDPRNKRFSTLVALMLSAQTKDEITHAAVSNLRAALGGTLSVENVISAKDETISGAICKVGFWNRKTQYLKKTAVRLRDDFDSDLPQTIDELCSLPGVGPKMAFLALGSAWNINVGIGVDVHVHRITNRLGWHEKQPKNPEETRVNLESWLPKELFQEINHLLVGFGQTICLPIGPRCDLCDLSSKGLCPSAQTVKTPKSRKALVFASPDAKLLIKLETAADPLLEDDTSDVLPVFKEE